MWITKTSSTPHDPSVAFAEGIDKILRISESAPDNVRQVLHGTTVATNAILESRGARTGMLTTAGFRHVLEIGRHDIPRNANMFDWVKPTRPVPPERIFEIGGRIDHDGSLLQPLDEDAVRLAAQALQSQEVEAVAVCFLHSYANPAHERRAREIISEVFPEAMISLSCEVLPVFREYERSMATLLNVYVMPLVSTYVGRLESRLSDAGIKSPLLLMKSSGGVASAPIIRREPLLTALSGPAAGVTGSAAVAAESGTLDFVTIDIGGTSADICLIQGSRADMTTEGNIGEWPLTVPMIDITTIGAGGGSIASVSKQGALRVGPESAGAVPGPACYGRGGELPTVTDAHAVLGNLLPHLLGGELMLDREAARSAVSKHVAEPLGLSVEEAAAGILRVVNNNMMGAIRVVSIERGHDPRNLALLPFGGAGPLHAGALARLLGIKTIVVPPSPGVLSSFGLLVADLRNEYSRTAIQRPPRYDLEEIATVYRELEAEAEAWFENERIPAEIREVRRLVSARYEHQGFELTVPWPEGGINETMLASVVEEFEKAHLQLYTFNQPGTPVELVTFRVEAVGKQSRPSVRLRQEEAHGETSVISYQDVWFDGAFQNTPVHDRRLLKRGASFDGPAIVKQPDTTLVILPGQRCEVHPSASLLIREISANA
jgi:N-methylhydantoinase A